VPQVPPHLTTTTSTTKAMAPPHHSTHTPHKPRKEPVPMHIHNTTAGGSSTLQPTSTQLPPVCSASHHWLCNSCVSSWGRTQAGSLLVRCHCLTDVWGAASPPQGPVFSGVSLVGATAPDTPGATTTYTARRSGHCHHSNKQQRSADDHLSRGPTPDHDAHTPHHQPYTTNGRRARELRL
jgi:hypothetical protein